MNDIYKFIWIVVILYLIFARKSGNKTVIKRDELERRRKNKYAVEKGRSGERDLVKEITNLFAPGSIFMNVYVLNEKYGITEVDVVAVDKTGLYVFESKNYSGFIYGNLKSHEINCKYNNGEVIKMYNPVFQNYKHTEALKTTFDLSDSFIHSYVVFGKNAKLGSLYSENKSTKILEFKDIQSEISNDIKLRNDKPTLNTETIDKIKTGLIKASNVSDEIKAQHIREISKKKMR